MPEGLEDAQRSPVHEIVNALWGALHALGSGAGLSDIERWGFSIHAALSAAGRAFHNHDHVVAMIADADPIEVIAALYHDAVYIQVDQGPPRSMRAELDRVLAAVPGSEPPVWRVLPAAGEPATRDVLAVFDRAAGDLVSPLGGLNELASALVVAIQLGGALAREQRIAIAACIEQTIPFRADPVPALHRRLAALGLAGDALDATVRRAVRLGNRDIENFAENDPARFLDNTWKLLPESNPALHAPLAYTVCDYRVALQRMEVFLAGLAADCVFHAWGGEPRAEVHARRVARTSGNLGLAVRYLRAKLYSIALVEAIVELTGGDVPLDYFMGGDKSSIRRINEQLPRHDGEIDERSKSQGREIDSPLHRLLAEGRASESPFDTGPSPLGAFLHAVIGEPAIMQGVELAKRWWGGGLDAAGFLASQPRRATVAIVRAAANIIETRHDRLFALAERLESQ